MLDYSLYFLIEGPLLPGQPVCVEISLETTEKEFMALECWCIRMLDQKDSAISTDTVYEHMSLMLKSLLCITRATKAYRLSRNQGHGNFRIRYEIYKSTQDLSRLGAAQQTRSVGRVTTPMGTLDMSVTFRTELRISQNSSSLGMAEDFKDDHFETNNGNDTGHVTSKQSGQSSRDQR